MGRKASMALRVRGVGVSVVDICVMFDELSHINIIDPLLDPL